MSLGRFPADGETSAFTFPLGRDVQLQVRRTVDANGLHMGWDLSAVDRRLRDSPNFLYQCLCGHGPRPNDLYAWHFIDMHYPAERVLPVFGYPLEVRVRCDGCRIEGKDSNQARFVAGTVDLSWRRLPQSNPRQETIADLRKATTNPKREE